MGFNKINGKWERRSGTEDKEADLDVEAPGPSEVRPPVSQSPGPSSFVPPAAPVSIPTASTQTSTGFSEMQLEQLRSVLMEQEKKFEDKLEDHKMKMIELFYSLEDKISSMDSTLGSSAQSLKVDLMRMFEKIKDIGEDSDVYSSCNAELQERIKVAASLVEDKLNGFVKVQEKAMTQILDELKRLLRFGH